MCRVQGDAVAGFRACTPVTGAGFGHGHAAVATLYEAMTSPTGRIAR